MLLISPPPKGALTAGQELEKLKDRGSELEMSPSLQCPAHQRSTHSPSQEVHIIRFLDDTGIPRDSSGQQQPWTHGELRLLPESKQELLGRKRGRRENQTKQSLGKQDSSKNLYLRSPLSQESPTRALPTGS